MPETRALSEANLRTIIETIPQYVWRTNPDGSGDYFSERFCQFVGKSMDEVLGWGWFALIHPDDQPAVQVEWARCRELQIPVSWDFRILKEGNWHWVKAEGNPFFEAGVLSKYYGTWTDIHDRKLTEAKVASAQDAVATEAIKLALITNVLPAFISYVDREERYQFVNDAYEEWFKVKREDTIGKNTLETQGRETYDNV
ncbi:MAG: PAS domain S-box protein, partial [Proteobacteria bacterium]